MEAISESIDGAPDRDYALSVVSPFHAASKGARNPNLQPIQTVTGTNFQDLGTFSCSGASSLLITNFTAFNTPPWMYITGIQQSTLDQVPVAK